MVTVSKYALPTERLCLVRNDRFYSNGTARINFFAVSNGFFKNKMKALSSLTSLSLKAL